MRILVSVESLERCNIHTSFYLGWKRLEGLGQVEEVAPFFCPRVGIPQPALDLYLTRMVLSMKPNMIVAMKGEGCSHAVYYNLSSTLRIPLVFYQIDDPFELNGSLLYSAVGDRVYTTDMSSVESYKRNSINCRYMSFGYHDFGIRNQQQYRHEASFIGTGYPHRVKFLREVYERYNRLIVYGCQGVPGSMSRLTHEEAWRTAAQTKVNLVFSDQPDGHMGTKNKMIEMMGQGCFCLVQNFPGLKELYLPEYYDTFTTPADLIEKIKYWVAHDKEREQKAKAAQQFISKNYTYTRLAQEILKEVTGV